MKNKELVGKVLGSNLDADAKTELVDLIYRHREEAPDFKFKIRKKRTVKGLTEPDPGDRT